MQEVNEVKLTEDLLELLKSAPGSSEADMRVKIGRLINEALPNSRETDSRRVTVLLSDLRGFTSMAEKFTAREIVGALNRYYERMSEIIIRNGGTIDKFIGDAIMVLFGAPIVRDNDIEAALVCAIEMQLAMDAINADNKACGLDPLFMGIGINTGEMIAGYLGSTLHHEYTVIGDQVNLTSRIEAHSLRGQILLSENIYLAARDFIEIGDINEVKVKGKAGALRTYELLATRRPALLAAPKREIRKSPRVDVDMPLVFQLLRGKSVLADEFEGRVVNISYGGMYLASPVEIEPFGEIKIAVSLTLLGSALTEIYAKVLKVSQIDDSFACAVEFTSIDINASLAIKEFVDGIVEMKHH